MATIKISELPEASSLVSSDLLTAVATNVSSKITLQNFAKAIPQVSSSISASYALSAGNGGVTSIIAGTGISIDTGTGNVTITNTGGGGGGGSSGTSGQSGAAGAAGTSGTSGQSGAAGATGTSGTSGQTGASGSSGTSGQTGSSGSSGTSGVSSFPYTGSAIISGSLTTTGSIYIKDGSIVFNTAASDYDKGIKFANPLLGSSDPNTLEYYEEGTWDPTLSSSGATFSYSDRSGVYTRIGDIVKISFFILLNTSGNSGFGANALTMNLPKTANDNAAVGDLHWSATANTAIRFPYRIVGSTVNFYKTTAATIDTFAVTMKSNDLSTTAGSVIYGTIVYKV